MKRKYKVTFYLSGGLKMSVNCSDIDISKLSGTIGKRRVMITNPDRIWSVDIDKIEGYTVCRLLFPILSL